MNNKYILNNEILILESLSKLNLILEDGTDCDNAKNGKDGWKKCPKKRYETADTDKFETLECEGTYYIREKGGLLDDVKIPDIPLPTTADGWKEIAKIAYEKLKKEGAKIGEKIKEVGGKFFEKIGDVIASIDLSGTPESSASTETAAVEGPKYIRTNASMDDVLNRGIIIKKGMEGSIVSEIQQKLLDKGIEKVSEIGTASGIFDDVTEQAVMEFQKKFSLPENGIIDSETLKKLNRRDYIVDPSAKTRFVDPEVGF